MNPLSLSERSWVTKVFAVAGLLLALYGLITKQINFGEAIDLFTFAGLALGLGRKLDRVHEVNERVYHASTAAQRDQAADLNELIRQHQEYP